MTSAERWTLVIQGLAIGAALALAVLAIWGDWVRSILAAPKLTTSLRSQEGELTTFGDGRPVRYYHLVVKNSRRWAPARNVVPYVILVERPGPDGHWRPAMFTGPISLPWQFGRFTAGLPLIGRDRICDLGRVAQGQDFELTTVFRPHNFDPIVRSSEKMRVHAAAIGDNGESPPLVVEIAWDGHWIEGAKEMQRHLVIKEVESTSYGH